MVTAPTPDVNHPFWVPDGFALTLAWWHNAQITRQRSVGGRKVDATAWFKHLSHGRPFADFTAGQIAAHPQGYGGRCAQTDIESHDDQGPWGDGHQVAVICAPHTQVIAIDVDDPDAYAGSRLAHLITRQHAASTRGAGWHALVYIPSELLDRFPTQGPIPGGDLKANGFVPLPGSVHHSGERYAPQPGRGLIVATTELLAAAHTDRITHHDQVTHDGSGVGDGDEPTLFTYCGQLVAEGLSREDAWAQWLTRAEGLTPRIPDWPWSAADEDVFSRQWDYCLTRHRAQYGSEASTEALRAWAATLSGGTPIEPPRPAQEQDEASEGDVEDALSPPPPDDVLAALWAGEPGYRIPTVPIWHELREDGLASVEGAKGDQEVYLAFRPMIVSGLRITEDGQERYEVAWLDSDAVRRTVVIDADDLSLAALARLFPAHVVNARKATRLAEYLGHCVRVNRALLVASRTRVATAVGWFGDTAEIFVVGPDRPHVVEDVKNTGSWLAGYTTSGSLDGWRAAVWAAQDRLLVQILVTAGLAAPLLRIVGSPSFVVDIAGSTSQGKTISQGLSAAAWGDPRGLVLSWQNTVTASEHYLAMSHGCPIYLSESQLANETGVETLIYSLVEGRSRGRSQQDGSRLLDSRLFETVVVSSGERPLTSFTRKGGVVPRVVTLSGSPFESAATADAARRAASNHHGWAGEALVAALQARPATETRVAHQELLRRLQGQTDSAVAARRAESVATLAIAHQVAADARLIPRLPDQVWPWLVAGGDTLTDHEDDRPRQALELVFAAMASNPAVFATQTPSWTVAGVAMGDVPPVQGWAGRYEAGEYLAVFPSWVKELFERNGHDYETVVRAWRERGWISTYKPTSLTDRVRIGGRTASLIKVTHLIAELGPRFGDAEGPGMSQSE